MLYLCTERAAQGDSAAIEYQIQRPEPLCSQRTKTIGTDWVPGYTPYPWYLFGHHSQRTVAGSGNRQCQYLIRCFLSKKFFLLLYKFHKLT